jgi:hypothetical protein
MIKPTLKIVLAGLLLAFSLAIWAVVISVAFADDEPDEARKVWALKRAYELNGNSMVRHPAQGSIDLSQESPPVVVDPGEVNALDAAATPPASTRSRRRRDK